MSYTASSTSPQYSLLSALIRGEHSSSSTSNCIGGVTGNGSGSSSSSIFPLGLEVTVPTCSLVEDTEGKYTLFHIVCKIGIFTWEVRKRYTQFKHLQDALSSGRLAGNAVLPALPKKKIVGSSLAADFVEERRLGLEAYLRQLCVQNVVLSSPVFVEFLEDKSMAHRHLFEMQDEMTRIKDTVSSLQADNLSLKEQLKVAKEDAQRANLMLTKINDRVSVLENTSAYKGSNLSPNSSGSARNSSFTFGTSNEAGSRSSSVNNPDGGTESSQLDDTRAAWFTMTNSLSRVSLGGLGASSSGLQQIQGPSALQSDWSSGGGFDEDLAMRRTTSLVSRASASSLDRLSDSLIPQMITEADASAGYFVSQMVVLGNRGFSTSATSSTEAFPPTTSGDFFESGGSTWSKVVGKKQVSEQQQLQQQQHQQQGSPESYLLSPQRRLSNKLPQIINVDLIPTNVEASLLDTLVDEVVTMVAPTENQMHYRRSISNFLSRQCYKILGAKGFDIGLQGFRCFLPDDPVQVSIFLSRGHDVLWHVRLNERLCRLSASSNTLEEDGLGLDSAAQSPLDLSHSLSNVIFLKTADETGHRVLCIADTAVGGEIFMNARLELCLIAFWEDFSRAIGKNNLFKRSLLLIRAWWVYEAKMHYFASGIPDSALVIMVMSIFNRFYDRLNHPLQVFCQFLSEFSTVDLSSNVITINGPVPVDAFISTPENQLTSPSSSGGFLSQEFLRRYQNLALAKEVEVNSISSLMNETSDAPLLATPAEKSRAFGGRPIMVAHPLISGKNMIPDQQQQQQQQKDGRANAQLVTEAIRAGATAVLTMLAPPEAEPSGSSKSAHLVVETMFQTIIQRFGRGWKPDSPPLSFNPLLLRESYPSVDGGGLFALSSPLVSIDDVSGDASSAAELAGGGSGSMLSDPMLISLDKLWERILYCNLILESRVSESALHTLSCQVLKEKGPLPVGEVGKMLQEACPAIQNLSLILKERFNGLKKFLERYMEDFVLGQDHPFNPTVYLRCLLTPEDLAAIKRGECVQLAAFGGNKAHGKKSQRGTPGSANKGLGGGGQGARKKQPYPHSFSMSNFADARQHNPTSRAQRNSIHSGDSISRGLGSSNQTSSINFRNSISGPMTGTHAHTFINQQISQPQVQGIQYLPTARNTQASQDPGVFGGWSEFTGNTSTTNQINGVPDHSVLARVFVPRSQLQFEH